MYSQTGITANTLLTHVVMELKSGNIRRCEAMGLTLEEIQELNKMTVDDLHYLINTPVSIVTLSINHTHLNTLLAQARCEQSRLQTIDRALRLGGSIELMQNYFGLTASEVSTRRRLNGLLTRQGRNYMPSEEQDVAIWEHYKQENIDNLESFSALEAMMSIAEEHTISLTTVWNMIKNWSV